MRCSSGFKCRISSAASCSVSREAVPLPIVINVTNGEQPMQPGSSKLHPFFLRLVRVDCVRVE